MLLGDAAAARRGLRRRGSASRAASRTRTTPGSRRCASARSKRRASRARTARRSTACSSSRPTTSPGADIRRCCASTADPSTSINLHLRPRLADPRGARATSSSPPIPRGSSGRGEKFSLAIWADWGHKDAQDVLAAVDDAAAARHRGSRPPRRRRLELRRHAHQLRHRPGHALCRPPRAAPAISNMFAGYGTDQYVREYEAELGAAVEELRHLPEGFLPVPARRPDPDADALSLRRVGLQRAAA